MEWKNIKDELPPMGKKILIERRDNNLQVMTLGYVLTVDDDRNDWAKGMTTEQLQQEDLYWLLIPERKKYNNLTS